MKPDRLSGAFHHSAFRIRTAFCNRLGFWGIIFDGFFDKTQLICLTIKFLHIFCGSIRNFNDLSHLMIGIGSDMRWICHQQFSANQTSFNAFANNLIEYITEHRSTVKLSAPKLRDGRMIRNALVKINSKEPTISNVYRNFLFQSAFRINTVQISNQQHLDQNNRINRRPSGRWVEVGNLVIDKVKADKSVQITQKMLLRH